MKITATTTSTSVKDLIVTAGYDLGEIEKYRIKDKNNNNAFGVYIANTGASSIYLENIYDSTVANGFEIVATGDFSLDVSELSKLNLIIATGTQAINLIIT